MPMNIGNMASWSLLSYRGPTSSRSCEAMAKDVGAQLSNACNDMTRRRQSRARNKVSTDEDEIELLGQKLTPHEKKAVFNAIIT